MEIAQTQYFIDLRKEVETAPHGKKKPIIQKAMNFLGISYQQVYRGLIAAGYNSGRKIRTDKGKSEATLKELKTVSGIMMASIKKNKKRLLGIEDALEIARANNLIQCNLSPSQILRQLRIHGLHPDQLNRPKPYVNMRSLFPNHTWEFDVSVCVVYYISDSNGMQIADEKKFYKNKPQNLLKIAKERVLRYVVTDHCSGVIYIKYYMAAGEDQQTLFEFLMSAFGKKPDDVPFHGVPYQLIWDAGSANQSYMIRNLLDALGVDHWAHIPGNPRAKGQVEGGHNIVERKFEGRLRFKTIKSVEQLNQYVYLWQRAYNSEARHRRTKTGRFSVWQRIRPKQLRVCPPREVCQMCLRTVPEMRMVSGNYTVSYKVKGFDTYTYSVSHLPDIRVGEKIKITVNPYNAPSIYAILPNSETGRDTHYELTPLERDQYGFFQNAAIVGQEYKSQPESDIDRNRKELDKTMYGVETDEELRKAKNKNGPVYGGKIDSVEYLKNVSLPAYIQRPGTELNIPDPAAISEAKMSAVQAAKYLKGKFGDKYEVSIFNKLKAKYPGGITQSELDKLTPQDFITKFLEIDTLRRAINY